jgi:hypothetical protein
MRRSLLQAASVALFGFAALVSGGSVNDPNTPADFATDASVQQMCQLSSLQLSGGLSIIGQFLPNKYHYQCSCSANFEGTTQVRPTMFDGGSSAEVSFNSQKINFRSMGNAVSNGGPNGQAPNSPLFQSDPLTFVPGTNTIVIGVGCNGRALPQPCYYQYTITCDKPSYIVGDPQFVGLRGQSYQVHGVSGEIYNIVSDADLQYNSKFVFLDSGACPVVNGKKQKGCFSHPGSYLGELGLKTRAGDKIHVVTGNAKQGFASVSVNGKDLAIGETVILAGDMGSVSLNNTHLTSIQVGNWDFAFENSDMFVNQRVRVLDARGLRSHGLLGQTWRDSTYPNSIKYIAGSVDDYVIRDGDIFGDSFVYNTFN